MPEPLQNFRLTIAYDGRELFGWQRHGQDPTVQGELERALGRVFGTEMEVRGSGRTDRGAHAEGQVANAFLPVKLDLEAQRAAINDVLPPTIRVLELLPVAESFHARTSAIGKRYRYVIHNARKCPPQLVGRVWHLPGVLDASAMRAALPLFIGKLDFASFATKPNHVQASTVREVTELELTHRAPTLEISIRADGFLYKMVRNIVRALVKVGQGRYSQADVQRIIAARDRSAAPGTAPASGLYLERVYYPPVEDEPSASCTTLNPLI